MWCLIPAGLTARSARAQWRVHVAVVVTAVLPCGGCVVLVSTGWTIPDTRRPADMETVTAVAGRVAQSVTTVDAGGPGRHLTDVAPYVTDLVSATLKEKIVDRLPARVIGRQSPMRALSVEVLTAEEASVVAVVDRHNPSPHDPTQTDSTTIEPWLLLTHRDGHWLVNNIGLAL